MTTSKHQLTTATGASTTLLGCIRCKQKNAFVYNPHYTYPRTLTAVIYNADIVVVIGDFRGPTVCCVDDLPTT